MKFIGTRTSFQDAGNKTTIVIAPENVFWHKGLMSAWFSMWMVIGITMFWAFNTLKLNEQEKLIVVIFLVFWVYYAFKVGKLEPEKIMLLATFTPSVKRYNVPALLENDIM